MSRPANFDVIEFHHANKRHLRVYYKFNGEHAIRESCYYESYGWFVRGEGVVTQQVKSSTRMTATRWLDDQNNMKICVFYLNDTSQICWSHTDQELTTPWASTNITDGLPKVEIEPSSGFAVSLPDNQNQALRLFFQEKAIGNTGGPLRELRYNYANQAWQLINGRIVADTLKGTRLSAASDNLTKALRLYYEGSDMALCEVACDRNYRWGARTTIQKDLIPQAPISVVSWDSGQPVPDIRVYTVTSTARRRILELSYTFPKWQSAIVPAPGYRDPSGMAACRNTGWDVNVHSPIYFFHQPGRREIAMTLLPADDSADSRMLVSKILPLASLPVTIDGPMKDSREGAEGQSAEETIKNLHKELTDSKLEANQLRTANEELTKKLEAAQNNNDAKKADKAAAGKRDPLGEFFAYIDRRSEFLQVDIYNVIRSLYLDGFDINGNDTTGSGRSALIDAINQHGKQIVTVLLSRDIDFQATDSTGDNPLNAACRSEEEGIVRALLEKGSNPNVKDKNGRTPLHEAASRSNKTIVSLLLDKGAPVDSGDADGNTPLHIASSRDIMFLLLQRKADVNARNVKGETPLWYTSSIPEMQLLVENRANVNVFDNYGWGRLHWAVANKAESVIRYLVGAGRADINLQLPDKPTALHIAVLFRHESLVRLLLAAGADRDRRWSGYTPLDYARRDGYQSLIELLQ